MDNVCFVYVLNHNSHIYVNLKAQRTSAYSPKSQKDHPYHKCSDCACSRQVNRTPMLFLVRVRCCSPLIALLKEMCLHFAFKSKLKPQPGHSLFQCGGPYGLLPMAMWQHLGYIFWKCHCSSKFWQSVGFYFFLFHPCMFCHAPVYSYTGSQRFVFNFSNPHQPLS